MSKVPNCKDSKEPNAEFPGPGTYIKLTTKGGQAGDSFLANESMHEAQNSNANAFMSGTHRVDFWSNEGNAPYTKQTYMKNPGPGHYTLGKKKGDDIKSKLLIEETVNVPFGSSDERAVNKKTKLMGPGPGQYIDINNPNNSSICKSLNKIKEDRTLAESQGVKLGAFGTTTGRFEKGWMKTKDGPGPGYYDSSSHLTQPTMDLSVTGKTTNSATQMETTLATEAKKPNSIFTSTVDRFNVCYSAKNPNLRLL